MDYYEKKLDGSFVFAKELISAIIGLIGADGANNFLVKNFSKREFAVLEGGEVFVSENLEKEHFMTLFQKTMGFLKGMLGNDLAKNVFKNVFLAVSQKGVSPESMHLLLELVPLGTLENIGAEFK